MSEKISLIELKVDITNLVKIYPTEVNKKKTPTHLSTISRKWKNKYNHIY
jgi:hypothetical protein